MVLNIILNCINNENDYKKQTIGMYNRTRTDAFNMVWLLAMKQCYYSLFFLVMINFTQPKSVKDFYNPSCAHSRRKQQLKSSNAFTLLRNFLLFLTKAFRV